MTDEQSTKSMKLLEDFSDNMDKGFASINSELRDIKESLNMVIDQHITDTKTRQATRNAQMDSFIEWAHKVGEKTGIPLENS